MSEKGYVGQAEVEQKIYHFGERESRLATIPADRRKPVRDCAWYKEALDARLYQLGARFLAGSTLAETSKIWMKRTIRKTRERHPKEPLSESWGLKL
jgi:hypothetical protein